MKWSGCGVFGMRSIRDVGCLGCGIIGLWDLRDVGCSDVRNFG